VNWRFKTYYAVILVLTVAAYIYAYESFAVYRSDLSPERFLLSLGVLFALSLVSFFLSIELPTGGSTLSVTSLVFFTSIFNFGPFWTMLICGTTYFLYDKVSLHKSAVKYVHNILQISLSVFCAGLVFYLTGGRFGVLDFPPVIFSLTMMVLTYFAINSMAVSCAIGFFEGISPLRVWYDNCRWQFFYTVASLPLLLLMLYLYQVMKEWGIVLFFLPLMMVRQAYLLYVELKKTYKETVLALVKGIEASDPYTSGHSERVSIYARNLATAMDLPYSEVEKIEIAAILHDVGKIGGDYHNLIKKPAKLTDEEYKIIQEHPVLSANLVSHISFLRGEIEKVIRHHHESYGGNGYPDGLKGEEIPLGSRIIMVSDAYDAMTTDRPYRQALSHERAIDELQRYAGYQFDPAVVEVMLKTNLSRDSIQGEETPRIVMVSRPDRTEPKESPA
jgi:hypothetical protein